MSSGIEGRLLGRHVKRCASHRAEGGEQAVLREPKAIVALARPKSITLGTGFPSWRVDKNVRWFQVAMDNPLLVCVLHCRADLAEERQAFRRPR